MSEVKPDTFLPVELVFNPNWWHHAAGISFAEPFYLDADTRIRNDVIMRRVLHERYGELGLGEADPQPRPVIGSMHVAGGFVIPALLGASIRFEADAAPQPGPCHWTIAQIENFKLPDWQNLWPMTSLIADMDTLTTQHGYVIGDLNTDGLLNAAYHFYGQDLFTDFYNAPDRVRRFLGLIGELIGEVAGYIHRRTGSYSIAVNRMPAHLTPTPFLHANCSVQMISPKSYREMQLPIEQQLAANASAVRHSSLRRQSATRGRRVCQTSADLLRSRLGIRCRTCARSPARCLFECEAEPHSHAAVHALRNCGRYREVAASRRAAGESRSMLHQSRPRHARREFVCDV